MDRPLPPGYRSPFGTRHAVTPTPVVVTPLKQLAEEYHALAFLKTWRNVGMLGLRVFLPTIRKQGEELRDSLFVCAAAGRKFPSR